MKKYFFAILCSFLLVFFSCNQKKKKVFPKGEWLISTPEQQGVDSKKMNEALDYLASNSLSNKNREVLIIRNGYQIYAGDNIDCVHNIHSCSKTFTSTVLGLLVDDGKLTLDTKASKYEPLLKDLYPEVTFRHFATMTSGYNAKGRSRWENENEDWSWTPYEPDSPYFAPGTAFAYWDEAQMMFGRVLTQVLQRPMIDFLKERVTNEIGMDNWKWLPEKDISGININTGGSKVQINAKQFARWGYLFLNDGNWDGKQLISKNWVRMATSVQVPANLPTGNTDRNNIVGSGCYGFNWWVNGKHSNDKTDYPGAPEGLFYASGNFNNHCFVIKQWNMVIVRMGEDGDPKNIDEGYNIFLNMIGKSFIK